MPLFSEVPIGARSYQQSQGLPDRRTVFTKTELGPDNGDGCAYYREKDVWNADNGHNGAHFCGNEEVYLVKTDAETAIEAIVARIQGEWDNPALVAFGPLNQSCTTDILHICESVKEACTPLFTSPMKPDFQKKTSSSMQKVY